MTIHHWSPKINCGDGLFDNHCVIYESTNLIEWNSNGGFNCNLKNRKTLSTFTMSENRIIHSGEPSILLRKDF